MLSAELLADRERRPFGALAGMLSPVPGFFLFVAFCAVVHVALALAARYTNDEGYYLCSSALAMKGLIPYRDFAFWQTPPMLYVYGLVGVVFGHSLLIARLASSASGLAAFVLMAGILKRRASRDAVYVFAILVALNMSYAFDTSIVKTQSLCILLYAAALAAAVGGRMTVARAAASSALVAAAVGARAPLLPMLPFFWAFVYFESGRNLESLIASVAASLAVLGAGFALFDWLSEGRVAFGLWGFYRLMEPLPAELFWKQFVPIFVGNQWLNYALFLGVLTALGVLAFKPREGKAPIREWPAKHPFECFLAASYLAITLLHLLSPVRYPTHQTTNMPLLVLFLAIILGKVLAGLDGRTRTFAYAALVALSLLGIAFQDAPVERSDGEWPYERIQEVARLLRERIPHGGRLLTFQNIVAYEGRFELLEGLNIGVEGHFGARGMSTEQCRKYKGVDNRILRDDLAEGLADAVVIQERDLGVLDRDRSGVSRKDVLDALSANYEAVGAVRDVGQFGETAYCFVKKPGAALRRLPK